jgi:hypothetical protein
MIQYIQEFQVTLHYYYMYFSCDNEMYRFLQEPFVVAGLVYGWCFAYAAIGQSNNKQCLPDDLSFITLG